MVTKLSRFERKKVVIDDIVGTLVMVGDRYGHDSYDVCDSHYRFATRQRDESIHTLVVSGRTLEVAPNDEPHGTRHFHTASDRYEANRLAAKAGFHYGLVGRVEIFRKGDVIHGRAMDIGWTYVRQKIEIYKIFDRALNQAGLRQEETQTAQWIIDNERIMGIKT